MTWLRWMALAAAVAVTGCGSKAEEGADHRPDAVYTVRGIVKSLPRSGESEMFVMHEAIDGFVNREGKRTGMDSMSMAFRLQPGVTLDGIEVADKVSMTVEVHWHAKRPLEIATLEEIPADTELLMRRAEPPAE